MIPFDFNLVVYREPWNFEELTEQVIQERLTNLTEYYEWIRKEGGWLARRHLFLSEDLFKKIETVLSEEISYYKFYLEFQAKQKEPNFNKWVFTPKERVVKEYSHQETHDQWTKTNGRIRAIVEIDKSGKMTKISVRFRNDSEALKFIDNYYGQPKIKPAHAKNIQSITQNIEKYKQISDEFLQEHLFPPYNAEKRSFDILKKLLCIKLEVLETNCGES